MKRVLLYLDTNKIANPFDMLLAVDADYDVVLPYSGINEGNVEYIVQNSVFARGEEGLRNTVIMLGGKLDEAEILFNKLKRIMRDPFRVSVVLDPGGACTTAASVVAEIEKESGGVRGKKITILAGTGPIGQVCALLLRNLGARVRITSRDEKKARSVASRLSDKTVGIVEGVKGESKEDRIMACAGSEVVIATGAIGAQLLDLEDLKDARIVADVNAVQPYGIGGMKAHGGESGNAKLIGPCEIGDLKNRVEMEILKRATQEVKFYDYNDALTTARELLRGGATG